MEHQNVSFENLYAVIEHYYREVSSNIHENGRNPSLCRNKGKLIQMFQFTYLLRIIPRTEKSLGSRAPY